MPNPPGKKPICSRASFIECVNHRIFYLSLHGASFLAITPLLPPLAHREVLLLPHLSPQALPLFVATSMLMSCREGGRKLPPVSKEIRWELFFSTQMKERTRVYMPAGFEQNEYIS